MKESLNDIIARLDDDNKSLKRDLALIKSANAKGQELLSNKIEKLNANSIDAKKFKDKDISELKNEIKELKSMIKALKPNPIKAFTDKDIKLSIDSVVTKDYITNLYRNK